MKGIGCDFLAVVLISELLLSSVQASQVCISPGGRFPPFSTDGHPPRKVAKGPRSLALCSVFQKYTCCDVAQTYPALLSVRRLASAGEANEECLHLWELLECSICDPRVGTQPGPPVICASFCDSVWKACSSAYFSFDTKSQVLSPCGLDSILCGVASEWVSNGTEFCRSAGFSVQPSGISSEVAEKQFCYGGKASLDSIVDLWKSLRPELSQKDGPQDLQGWFIQIPTIKNILWTVGGMVLTGGYFFHSRRGGYRHRQMQAGIRKLGMRVSQRATTAEGTRRGARG